MPSGALVKIAGLMTGTSADAIDVALVEFRQELPSDHPENQLENSAQHVTSGDLVMRLHAAHEIPFDPELKLDILRLLEPAPVDLQRLSRVDARLGQAYAEAVINVCQETGLGCDLVVSHGQTVWHDVADGQVTSTLQLGQPAWIAEATGAPVLSNLRTRDVAARGQGAPLTAILDELLLAGEDCPTAVLNLGGIANVTIVRPPHQTIAFDTGPANALIDLMARRITGDPHAVDHGGALAASGISHDALLSELLDDPYYQLPAPKTTGKEYFHQGYLDHYLQRHPGLADVDVLATLTALTARTVADACRQYQVEQVIASGGGTRNPELMRQLQAALGDHIPVSSSDTALNLPESAKEACVMALIGWLSWYGLPATHPGVTGAMHARIAGQFTPGNGPLKLPAPLERMPVRLTVTG